MTTRNGEPAKYEVDLLLVLPVCLGKDERGLLFESQACNGIERWLENFPQIQVICPLIDGRRSESGSQHGLEARISEIANVDRVKFVPLPFVTSLGWYSRVIGSGSFVDSAGDRSIAIPFLCAGRATVWRLGRGGLPRSTRAGPTLLGLDRCCPA